MSQMNSTQLFRLLPSVDELLQKPQLQTLAERFGRGMVLEAARCTITGLRNRISEATLDEAELGRAISLLPSTVEEQLLSELAYSLCPVINATGVILHTNLGRAPIGEAALQRVTEVARGYSNLEFDLESGERGERDVHVSGLMSKLLSTLLVPPW